MLAIAHRLLSQKDFEGPASCPIRSAQRKPLFSDGEGERGPTLIDTPFHLVAISANGSISVAQYGDGSVEEVCSRTAPGGFVAPLTVTVITSDGRGRSAKIEVEAARWEGQGLSGDGGIDHESRRGLGRVDPRKVLDQFMQGGHQPMRFGLRQASPNGSSGAARGGFLDLDREVGELDRHK
jgi:hypothetical protein